MAPISCEHGVTRDNCPRCRQLPSSSAKSFAYYASHIGSQFNALQPHEDPDHRFYISQLKDIISEQGLNHNDFVSQITIARAQDTYQLARFLDEPADYKSLVLPVENSNELKRKATHIVAVTKQTEDIDLLFDTNELPELALDASTHR